MPEAEGTRSKANLGEEEGMWVLLQETLRKLKSLDSHVSNMETTSPEKGSKGHTVRDEEDTMVEKFHKSADYYQDGLLDRLR